MSLLVGQGEPVHSPALAHAHGLDVLLGHAGHGIVIAAHEGGILAVGIVLYGAVSEPLHLFQTAVENSLQAQS